MPRNTSTVARTDSSDAPPYAWGALAAGCIFVLYLATLAPTTAMWDTSEYIAAAKVLGLPHPPPAQVRAGPVALLGGWPGHELLVGHRPPRRRLRAAVVRDARVGREAGPGEDHEGSAGEEFERLVGRGSPQRHRA